MIHKHQRLGVVAGCFLGTALGPAVTVFFTLGLFIAPLQSEFGWSQSEISLVIPALTLAVALASPLAGLMIDRWGAKRVIIFSMAGYGSCLFLFQFVQDLRAFYILFVVLGICCAGSNTMSFITVLAGWFDKNRGLMIGIASSGIGAGTLVLSPFVQWIIETAGWRAAYSAIGMIILVIGVPVFLLMIKNAPQAATIAEGAPMVQAGSPDHLSTSISFRQFASRAPFWLIVIGFVCLQGAIYSVGVYLAPIIQDNGGSVAFSVLCVSAFGGAVLVGRILTGILLDRFFAPLVCAAIFFGAMIGMLTLSTGAAAGLALACAVLIGFSSGTEGDALGYLTSRYVPRAIFGRVYAVIFGCCMLSLAGFPFLTGLAYDMFGNYHGILLILALLTAVSVGCMLKLPAFPHFDPANRAVQEVPSPATSAR